MEPKEYLKSLDLPNLINGIHLAITEKFPNKEIEYDAWYANKTQVVNKIENLGQEIAGKLACDFGLHWIKPMPDGRVLQDWKISPDGELLGLSILLAGWVASQFSAKLKGKSSNEARSLLNKYPSLIDAAIKIGMEIGQK